MLIDANARMNIVELPTLLYIHAILDKIPVASVANVLVLFKQVQVRYAIPRKNEGSGDYTIFFHSCRNHT